MVSDFLIARGWRVWFLGGFLPLEHLTDAVTRHAPDAVVLCISTQAAEDGLTRSIAWLRNWRGAREFPLIVGGGRFFANRALPEGVEVGGTDLELVTREMDRAVQARRALEAGAARGPEAAA
jgi:methanogenic corrinoid protein MtbC1